MKRLVLTLALLALPGTALASPIALYVAPDNTYQNTTNNPCVFYGPGGSGCNQNPAGWSTVGDTGGGTPFVPNPLVNTYGDAPGELALFAQYVGRDFYLGLDINDTSTPQTLDDLTVNFFNLGGTNIGSFTFAPATSVPSISNGVGYADYILAAGCSTAVVNDLCLLNGYLPFSAPAGTRSITFTFGLDGFNDGADKLFLISAGPTPVPFDDDPPTSVPDGGLTLALLGLSLTGLGVVRQRLQ
jgi:hypothetical protein